MIKSAAGAILLCLCVAPNRLFVETGQRAEARAATQLALGLVAHLEKQLTGVASEMPEEHYAFAPTEGAFRGVRTFAEQLKHAAAVNHLAAATVLGERVSADMADERGPDSVKTKAQVLQYLGESVAALKRAAATIDATTAFAPTKDPFAPAASTRIGAVIAAAVHASNHYGQLVEYLRLKGLAPPRTP